MLSSSQRLCTIEQKIIIQNFTSPWLSQHIMRILKDEYICLQVESFSVLMNHKALSWHRCWDVFAACSHSSNFPHKMAATTALVRSQVCETGQNIQIIYNFPLFLYGLAHFPFVKIPVKNLVLLQKRERNSHAVCKTVDKSYLFFKM